MITNCVLYKCENCRYSMYPKTKNTIKEIQVNTRCDCLDCKNPHVTKNDHKPFEKWKITHKTQTIYTITQIDFQVFVHQFKINCFTKEVFLNCSLP